MSVEEVSFYNGQGRLTPGTRLILRAFAAPGDVGGPSSIGGPQVFWRSFVFSNYNSSAQAGVYPKG